MPASVYESLERDRLEARRAALATERKARELARLREEHAALRVDHALIRLQRLLAKEYNPNQPRVPAGQPGGGQWTDGDDSGINPENVVNPQWASGRPCAPTRALINGRWQDLTPAQGARLAAAEARARDVLERVRERDPDLAADALSGPGCRRSDPRHRRRGAGGASALLRAAAGRHRPRPFRRRVNPGARAGARFQERGAPRDQRIGRDTGCHTCGTTEAGTLRDNFVVDHQLPNAWNSRSSPQRLYPHCAGCSARQGNRLLWNMR
jgi:hypothetical protein